MRRFEHVLSSTVLCSNVFFSSYFSEASSVFGTSSERLTNVLRTSSERMLGRRSCMRSEGVRMCSECFHACTRNVFMHAFGMCSCMCSCMRSESVRNECVRMCSCMRSNVFGMNAFECIQNVFMHVFMHALGMLGMRSCMRSCMRSNAFGMYSECFHACARNARNVFRMFSECARNARNALGITSSNVFLTQILGLPLDVLRI